MDPTVNQAMSPPQPLMALGPWSKGQEVSLAVVTVRIG